MDRIRIPSSQAAVAAWPLAWRGVRDNVWVVVAAYAAGVVVSAVIGALATRLAWLDVGWAETQLLVYAGVAIAVHRSILLDERQVAPAWTVPGVYAGFVGLLLLGELVHPVVEIGVIAAARLIGMSPFTTRGDVDAVFFSGTFLVMGIVGITVWVLLRCSLALPMVAAGKGVRLTTAWRLSEGYAVSMMFAGFLAGAPVVVVTLAALMALQPVLGEFAWVGAYAVLGGVGLVSLVAIEAAVLSVYYQALSTGLFTGGGQWAAATVLPPR